MILELAGGTDSRLHPVLYAIWFIFIAEVAIELVIACVVNLRSTGSGASAGLRPES